MDLFVCTQVAGLCEFFQANFAFKWFFTGVSPHVDFKSARPHETLAALVAFEWPFTCMPSKVVAQVPMGREGPITAFISAFKWPLTIVNPLMSL